MSRDRRTTSPFSSLKSGMPRTAERADADDKERDASASRRHLDRLLHLAAPRLAVGHHHEHLRVRRLAVDFLVAFDQPQAPVDAQLEVGVPGGLVLDAERRRLVEMVEEEEEGVRILGEPDLRRGDVREQRQRDPVVVPAQRVADDAQEPDRPLPAIAGDILHVHRRGAVLQDHQVDAALAHRGGRSLRARQRQDQHRRGEDQRQPERQVADDGEALAHRKGALAREPAHVAAPPHEPPHPDQQRGAPARRAATGTAARRR